MDKIVTEGKELGAHLYMLTGGEPMVRKQDVLKLCEKHNDCFFVAYSNSTLIDEELCQKIQKLGNLSFMLSIEGTPDTNDMRRGAGHYKAVMNAMDLLKKYGITKTEINKFVNDYEKIIEEFRNKISISIYNKIIYSDTKNKLSALRNFIKS